MPVRPGMPALTCKALRRVHSLPSGQGSVRIPLGTASRTPDGNGSGGSGTGGCRETQSWRRESRRGPMGEMDRETVPAAAADLLRRVGRLPGGKALHLLRRRGRYMRWFEADTPVRRPRGRMDAVGIGQSDPRIPAIHRGRAVAIASGGSTSAFRVRWDCISQSGERTICTETSR